MSTADLGSRWQPPRLYRSSEGVIGYSSFPPNTFGHRSYVVSLPIPAELGAAMLAERETKRIMRRCRPMIARILANFRQEMAGDIETVGNNLAAARHCSRRISECVEIFAAFGVYGYGEIDELAESL